ncbi:hypothetical protein GNI_177870 [Gregarina niphandrodes]|uniref:Uncharacterized protein n=1 Tax=Gregarina niphandrodes TaxID=110365 RepID=A0A023AX51_GRENI|nr:hypothetical protein GNI_177870 [Gregarina niphandrodes]EZG43289.1 hypothetical protein GNI_177870 [Gregarina niphandrodes]|eukprot:XP_011133455.1 hypothetical protein GNI_177870 [Gregarina niphandrodes]
MRTSTAVKSVGGAELLAALVTSEGIQSELDDQTSARFLTFELKGEGQVHAVALGSEVELQELDAKLSIGHVSGLDQCKLVFKSISRLQVFHVPEQTAPYTQSAVRNSVRRFLDEEAVGTETRHQIWVDAFGKCQSDTEDTGDDGHIGVPEDTGNDQLRVFTRKLKRRELPRLLPKVQQDWREGMKRSAVSSWTDCLGLEVARDAFNKYPLQTKMAVAGGALFALAGCYFNFFPPGVGGAPSDNGSTDLENYAKILPCANETQLEGTFCVEGIPYCMTARLKPERGCLPLPSDIGFGKLSEIARTATFDVCRASGRCEVADTKPETNSPPATHFTTLTTREPHAILPCGNVTHPEGALCVEGIPYCMTSRLMPKRGCLPLKSRLGFDKLSEIDRSATYDVCRMGGTCEVADAKPGTKSPPATRFTTRTTREPAPILPCVNSTRLDNVTCVEGVPLCLMMKVDPQKACQQFNYTVPLELSKLDRIPSYLDVCRASGRCEVADSKTSPKASPKTSFTASTTPEPAPILPCVNETRLEKAVCIEGVPYCATAESELALELGVPENACVDLRTGLDLTALGSLTSRGFNVCRAKGGCGIIGALKEPSTVSPCENKTDLEEVTCVQGTPLCFTLANDASKTCHRIEPSRLPEWIESNSVDVCRVTNIGCEDLPCVGETKGGTCIEGVPYCATSGSGHALDEPQTCLDLEGQFKVPQSLTSKGYNVCRAKGGCGIIGALKEPSSVQPCDSGADVKGAVCAKGVPLCVSHASDFVQRCHQIHPSEFKEMMDSHIYWAWNVCRAGNDECETTNPIPPCVDETFFDRAVCVDGTLVCITDKADPGKKCAAVWSSSPLSFKSLRRYQRPESTFNVCQVSGGCEVTKEETTLPSLLSKVEVPLKTCIGREMSSNGHPLTFSEECSIPKGGAFVCRLWDPVTIKNEHKCFTYGDDAGASFGEVRSALSTLYPDLMYCNLNHNCPAGIRWLYEY